MFPHHSSSSPPPSPKSQPSSTTGLQLDPHQSAPSLAFQDPTPRVEKTDPLREVEGNTQTHDELASPSPRRASGPQATALSTMEASQQQQGGLSAPRLSKSQAGGTSPSRIPHPLNALSPLQSFSPLQASPGPRTAQPIPETASQSVPSEGRGRLVRSMSRKQSMYASAAQWEKGQYGRDMENRQGGGLFSRITLVKAPDQESGLKKRSKSSSALAPFTSLSNSLSSNPTSDRGPRRSFAAASFGNSRPMHVRTPSGSGLGINTAHRLGDQKTNAMTPEAIFDLANSLKSPVAMPEGGFKGAELKRRKSAGSSYSRRSSHSFAITETSPGEPPIALEPVEYVQLEDDVLLPFVDRPEEVAELIAHPNNETLFTMLKTTFPKGAPREHWQALSPEEWNWKEFNRHLALTRIECPDYQWVFRARQACRRRSVALWEKLGVCFGCDGDLLNAGGEDGLPSTWGVNAHDDDDDEYYNGHTHVWIQGLEAVDPEEAERAERDFAGAFGDIVDEQDEERVSGVAGLGMGNMGAIGEDEEEIKDMPAHHGTPAQRAGNRSVIDPFHSPSGHSIALGHAASSPRSVRSKSFVGLTIQTSPPMGFSPSSSHGGGGSFVRSPSMLSPVASASSSSLSTATQTFAPYQTDRGPDAPLFPGSFKNLSVVPNLGRVAGVGGTPGVPGGKGAGVNNPLAAGQSGKWKLNRKQSGAGLSESAITFTSESDYGPIHDENIANR